ncbi:hypothetical protein COW36_07145 [bacterium (Candidatus Blackallbacteria) CG17_big_fil_post_rev_8_21_14_2_50_48_46]|uniref:Sensory/regulatory protein RpfC n=1 Tax=bacterium (Candidatus Blackallbacteria) CG17_big_fil_post_rev_8_21_14_2_50_48_46 TaxID=2014261 RepID=A0A2M7G764_9BACT|nr:MAG: hypothetical protein COW64_06655 [bacterium (Candidatus Blackallbacteria) CG18_big_fil_WC_8_21_14_2_50_49_26]PIW17837.1 MAG: hypothetical protein COW36_07145 [bacterium (Candidatus Blackallbacteria) CG17_big_fil_post_rev_8_21_14_2_50_48_46]PIW48513.1 MAG: hypothetical protein COW20_09100 [bacterium (Candidatus Blackallbacteria) CG13_big_fil_rev_8_21_14_2_50_49_14]
MNSPISILLVDDDEEDFLITENLLLKSNHFKYQIQWCSSYQAAQAALHTHTFDLVLVDYFLGNKTGIDFIAENRDAGIWIPTILLTGLGTYDTDLKAMQSGAADYLNKNTLTSSDLERSIRYALQQFQHQNMLRESKQRFKQLAEELEQRVEERTHALNQINQELQTNQKKLQLLYTLSDQAHQEWSLSDLLKNTLQKIADYLNSLCAAIHIPPQSPLLSLLNPSVPLFYCPTQANQMTCEHHHQCKDRLNAESFLREGEQYIHQDRIDTLNNNFFPENTLIQPVSWKEDLLFSMFFILAPEDRADPDLPQLMTQVTHQISNMLQQFVNMQLIKENEERLKQFMEAIPVGIFALSADGTPFYANRGAQELLKLPSQLDIPLQNLFETLPIYREGTAEPYPYAETPWQKALGGHDSSVDDLEIRLTDQPLSLQAWGRSVRDIQGNLRYAIATFADISEIKQTQRDLILARQKAEDANNAKSAFLANMSHEIRTPMNAILGFTQLLQMDSTLSKEQQQKLTVILQSGEHLLRLISDILEMSKIEAGHVSLELESVDIYQILSELESIFNAKAYEKKLDFSVSSSLNMPRHFKLDKQKLRQILFNLLSNAFKFTSQGQIELFLRVKPKDPHFYELTFKVRDTGLGIPPEEQEKVFQNFEQTSSGKQVHGGTGLGLAISQRFAKLMGGEISFESQVNQGSCFSLSLMASLSETTATKAQEETVLANPVFDFGHLHSPHALVVDDQIHNRDILRLLLEPYGFVVLEAANGQEALDIVEEINPDVIFLDMSMPIMDGLTCLKHLRENPDTQDICIIMITANAFSSDQQTCLMEGANAFVSKPYKKETIIELLSKHLSIKTTTGNTQIPIAHQITPSASISALQCATNLPKGLLKQLLAAAICSDEDHFLQLTQRVESYDTDLAQQLINWLQNYYHERLITFLETAHELQFPSSESS